MRLNNKFISVLLGCVLSLTACAQSASVGIATPDQALLATRAIIATTNATQPTSTPEPQLPQPTETQPPPAVTATSTETPAQPTEQPVPTTAPAAPESSGTTASVSCGRTVTYIVKPNDNLFRIALRYRTTIYAIARRNRISNIRLIHTGQVLRIVTCAQR